MGKIEKIKNQIITGYSDHNIRFNDIVAMLLHIGFNYRIKGSHHIFIKKGQNIPPINLQPTETGKAKDYQVKQVRQILIEHNL